MTVEISSVLPRIGFAIVVGFIFFLILRSELSRLQQKSDEDQSTEFDVNTKPRVLSRFKRFETYEEILNVTDTLVPLNSTRVKFITLILNDPRNFSEIRRELDDNRAKTDFLFWVIFGIAIIFVALCFLSAIIVLLQSHVALRCSSGSGAYRDNWWETKDEDYVNYSSFFRQNVKLNQLEEMEPIDADTRVHDCGINGISRHLSTIDENDEFNSTKDTKQLISAKFSVDLTPGVKNSAIIYDSYSVGNQKWYKVFNPPLVSKLCKAPDFRKSGMPYVCLPNTRNY